MRPRPLHQCGAVGVAASGPARESAAELAEFVDRVLDATAAKQVDVVGHGRGGMMPRCHMGFLGGVQLATLLPDDPCPA